MHEIALQVTGLRKHYVRPERTIEVLTDVECRVRTGEWVLITGNSGCGKTTLLHLLGALDRPDGGEISYFGRPITQLGPFSIARWRRQTIGFVFQSYQLFPELTALENVSLAGRLNGLSRKQAAAQAVQLLARVGLESRLEHLPAELSGGEQQRIGIARALMNRPAIILADEPTGNLDDANSSEIMQILEQLRRSEELTIVMATHSHGLGGYADRALVLTDGRLSSP